MDRCLIPATIHLPLNINHFVVMLKAAKACLLNNFLSCFATIAGSLVLFHYETIREQKDACPLIMCYSSSCGTGKNLCISLVIYIYVFARPGKTTALRIALSIYGALEESGNSPKTSILCPPCCYKQL